MSAYQASNSAGPLYSFEHSPGAGMDFVMDQSVYYDDQPSQSIQPPPTIDENSPTDYFNQYPNQWPAVDATQHFTHQPNASTHSFSSEISSFRSSNHSIFSQGPARDSFHSAISVSSQSSASRAHFISQAEHQLTYNSTTQSHYGPLPAEAPSTPAPRKRTGQHKVAKEKDHFKTCRSVTKQPRPCNKEQKYFCTACDRLFVHKADWKRHEETYQERREMFPCDLCTAVYFLDKDFSSHHVNGHRCTACDGSTACSEKRHVQEARKPRQLRTGWGCGFCPHFSSGWTERCDHIAMHIEKEGKVLADWHHSYVIYSLLLRPDIHFEWNRILVSKRRRFTGISWNRHSTGRVEGYPESNKNMQLQDRLEYYTLKDDTAALAQLAYDKAMKQADPPQVPAAPPVPPPKDHRIWKVPSLDDLRVETESWKQFVNAVIEDDILPTGVDHLEGWRA